MGHIQNLSSYVTFPTFQFYFIRYRFGPWLCLQITTCRLSKLYFCPTQQGSAPDPMLKLYLTRFGSGSEKKQSGSGSGKMMQIIGSVPRIRHTALFLSIVSIKLSEENLLNISHYKWVNCVHNNFF